MVKLADTQDLGSCGRPWGFESLHPHQKTTAKRCRFLILRDSKLLRNPKCSAFCFNFIRLKNSPKPVSVKAKKQTDKAKTAPQFCKKGLVFSPGCTLEQILAISESLHPHQRRRKATFITASAIACRLFLRLRLVVGAKLFISIF